MQPDLSAPPTKDRSLKLMLLGLMIMLFGAALAADPNSSLMGIEYLIMIVGFIVGLVGYAR